MTHSPNAPEPSPHDDRQDALPDGDLAQFLSRELGIAAQPAGPSDDAGDSAAGSCGGSWRFTGPIWVWRGGGGGSGLPSKGAWYFITIDGPVAAAIRAATAGRTGGFGSVRVTAQIGDSRWQTSLFPSKASGGFLLPVKAGVRRAQALAEGTAVSLSLTAL